MTDESRGDEILRYADVNTLILDTFGEQCLNLRYPKLIAQLNQTSWESESADGGTCVLSCLFFPPQTQDRQTQLYLWDKLGAKLKTLDVSYSDILMFGYIAVVHPFYSLSNVPFVLNGFNSERITALFYFRSTMAMANLL